MKVLATTAAIGFSVLYQVHAKGSVRRCKNNAVTPSFSYEFGDGSIHDITCSNSNCSCDGSGTGYTGCQECCCSKAPKEACVEGSNNDWIGTTVFGVFFFILLFGVIAYFIYSYKKSRNQLDPERGGDIHQDGYQNSSRSHSEIHYTFIPENDEDGVNGQNQSGSQHVLNRKKIYFTRSFSIP